VVVFAVESGSGRILELTRSFSDLVKADLERDTGFRRALLGEALACMASGDLDTGKIVLREYINGTVGFLKLGAALGRSPKSLMRMLSPTGNPQARNLFEMVAYLQKVEGTVLEVRAIDATAA
jgi:hypothetical protein